MLSLLCTLKPKTGSTRRSHTDNSNDAPPNSPPPLYKRALSGFYHRQHRLALFPVKKPTLEKQKKNLFSPFSFPMQASGALVMPFPFYLTGELQAFSLVSSSFLSRCADNSFRICPSNRPTDKKVPQKKKETCKLNSGDDILRNKETNEISPHLHIIAQHRCIDNCGRGPKKWLHN